MRRSRWPNSDRLRGRFEAKERSLAALRRKELFARAYSRWYGMGETDWTTYSGCRGSPCLVTPRQRGSSSIGVTTSPRRASRPPAPHAASVLPRRRAGPAKYLVIAATHNVGARGPQRLRIGRPVGEEVHYQHTVKLQRLGPCNHLASVGRGLPSVSPVPGFRPTQQRSGPSPHRRSYHHRYIRSNEYSKRSMNWSGIRSPGPSRQHRMRSTYQGVRGAPVTA